VIGGIRDVQLLAFLGALALLVCDAAAGLASRLARGLALAAATVLSAFAQVASLDSLDMLHNFTFYAENYKLSLAQSIFVVNGFCCVPIYNILLF